MYACIICTRTIETQGCHTNSERKEFSSGATVPVRVEVPESTSRYKLYVTYSVLTGLGQARDAHPWALDGYGIAKFDDGDVVVERAQPEVRVPMDFGHVMNGLATGFDFTVVFSNGHGKVFRTKTKNEDRKN